MCLVFVAEVGLKFVFDVKTTLNISEITFYPSRTTHGYDIYASAANKEDILFLNLENGKYTRTHAYVRVRISIINFEYFLMVFQVKLK